MNSQVNEAILAAVAGLTLGSPHAGRTNFQRLTGYSPIPHRMNAHASLDSWLIWTKAASEDRTAESLGQILLDGLEDHTDETAYGLMNLRRGFGSPLSGSLDNPLPHGSRALLRSLIWAFLKRNDPDTAARFAFFDASIDHANEGAWIPATFAYALAACPAGSTAQDFWNIFTNLLPSQSELHRIAPQIRENIGNPEAPQFFANQFATRFPHLPRNGIVASAAFVLLGLLHAGQNPEKAMLIAAGCGGQADLTTATTATIATALWGPLPPDYIAALDDSYIATHALKHITPPTTLTDFATTIDDACPEPLKKEDIIVLEPGELDIASRHSDDNQNPPAPESNDQQTNPSPESVADGEGSTTPNPESKSESATLPSGEGLTASGSAGESEVLEQESNDQQSSPSLERGGVVDPSPTSNPESESENATLPSGEGLTASGSAGEDELLDPQQSSPSPARGGVGEGSLAQSQPTQALRNLLTAAPDFTTTEIQGLKITAHYLDDPLGAPPVKKLNLTLTNQTTDVQNLALALTAPTGWEVASRVSDFALPPNTETSFPAVVKPAANPGPDSQLRLQVDKFQLLIPFVAPQRYWLVGPFTNIEGTGFRQEHPPEKNTQKIQMIDQAFSGRSDIGIRWQVQFYSGTEFNLEPIFNGGAGTAYLYAHVVWPTSGTIQVQAAYAGGLKFWVDGDLKLNYNDFTVKPADHPHYQTEFQTPGESHILIKLVRGKDPIPPLRLTYFDETGRIIFPREFI